MLFLGNFLYCQWTLVEPNPTNNNFDEKITKINFVKILDLRIFRPRNKLHGNYSPCGENSTVYCDYKDTNLIKSQNLLKSCGAEVVQNINAATEFLLLSSTTAAFYYKMTQIYLYLY